MLVFNYLFLLTFLPAIRGWTWLVAQPMRSGSGGLAQPVFDPLRPLRHMKSVTAQTPIFDKALQRARLRRALSRAPAVFLLERAVEDLVDRLSAVRRDFRNILDLGSPHPMAARALAARFPEADIVQAPPTLEARAEGLRAVVADEERLPFAAQSFDLVVSLGALQWTNDLPGALLQIRRLLRPDGLFLACFFGGRTLHELRRALAIAEDEARGGASPRVSPFVDLRDLGALLQRAGFALPVTDVDPAMVRYRDLFALARDLRAMGAANALCERSRRPLTREIWARAAARYGDLFGDLDGRVRATFELVWLSGWAPHESQGKPLAPGSARMRLADALGTKEGKLPG